MFEDASINRVFGAGHNRSPLDIRRHEDCGYTDPQPIKLKFQSRDPSCGGCSGKAIWRAGRRNDVIIEPAMLIVDNQQRGTLPKFRVDADCVIDLRNEVFAFQHVMVGMLIAGEQLPASRTGWSE